MKTGASVFLFLFILSVLSLSVAGKWPPTAFAQNRVPASTQTNDLDERIRRVETGLLPPVMIKGEPAAAMELTRRMQFYKTPGVSIAVINNGRIEWARGTEMLTPQVGGWGLGFELQGKNESARFAHSGSNRGYVCWLVAYAGAGQGAVVMTNSDRGGALSAEIMRSIAREYGWLDYLPKEKVIASVDTKILDTYVGQYQPDSGHSITITNENGKLMAQLSAGAKAELLAESETDFFLKQAAVQIKFVKDTQGKVTGLILRQGGGEIRALKIK